MAYDEAMKISDENSRITIYENSGACDLCTLYGSLSRICWCRETIL